VSERTRFRLSKRAVVSLALLAVSLATLPWLDLPAWFVVVVALALPAGYNYLAYMRQIPDEPATPDTIKLLAAAAVGALLWAVVILAIGYWFSS
jgi:hypothetical protein